jgi:hypothetical protein
MRWVAVGVFGEDIVAMRRVLKRYLRQHKHGSLENILGLLGSLILDWVILYWIGHYEGLINVINSWKGGERRQFGKTTVDTIIH